MSRSEVSQRNLRQKPSGAAPERLILPSACRVWKITSRYRQADIFRIPIPTTHTTAADALTAGLPVVTFLGGAFPARVAASLLNAMGMPELVADSPAGYEAWPCIWRVTEVLKGVKAKLASHRHTHALFDTDRFARIWSMIYTAMWRQAELG